MLSHHFPSSKQRLQGQPLRRNQGANLFKPICKPDGPIRVEGMRQEGHIAYQIEGIATSLPQFGFGLHLVGTGSWDGSSGRKLMIQDQVRPEKTWLNMAHFRSQHLLGQVMFRSLLKSMSINVSIIFK